jgi:phosphoadenosine phosphosulfate reductase
MAFDRAYDPMDSVIDGLNARLRHATPQEILREAFKTYVGKIAIVSSFGAESAVLLHLAAQVDPSVPVLFLDTGQHFGQTLDYRKQLAARLGLTNVRDLRPAFQDLALQDPKADLWKTDTDACCNIRKTSPLDRVLRPEFDAWITGRKRFQAATRAHLPVVERGEGDKIKFNPLANWTKDDLDAYVAKHDLPAHPLTAFGYPSIGCWPCTKAVEDGADARSGRWAGSEKVECGIHTPHVYDKAADHADNVGGGI